MLFKKINRKLFSKTQNFSCSIDIIRNPIIEASIQLQSNLKTKKNKYHNIKVRLHGLVFDSRAEYYRWHALLGFQARGVISGLKRQVSYPLPNGRRYVADFVYLMEGKTFIEDVKSPALLEKFMEKAILVRRAHKVIISPVHPKLVALHPINIHYNNIHNRWSRLKEDST